MKIALRSSEVRCSDSLLLEIKLLHDCLVALHVLLLEVLEVLASISNHLEKSASRVIVLLVLLEVLRELINLLRKECNLHLW